ncbi:MAG: prenyltransferase/squalene oxidase repeat-containing protein [Halobacteriota archaeon]
MYKGVTDEVADRMSSLGWAIRSELPGNAEAKSDREHLDATIEWIYRSQDVTGCGGSAATYNLVLGWEAPYPETSGYIIPTLFAYADSADSDEAYSRALNMADWVLTTQRSDGSFPGGTGETGEPNAFNTGQIILGLSDAYGRVGTEAYRRGVRDACEWLVATQADAGHWARYDYKSNPHTYSARIAWPLVVGAELLEDDTERYRDTARATLEWVVENQHDNGWFSMAGFGEGDDPFLHTIAYTIRGLIEGGNALDEPHFVESGRTAADVLLDLQARGGILKGSFDSDWESSWYYCLTGNAQMAIIWLRLYRLTGERDYLFAVRQAIEFLKRRQSLDGAKDIRGGVPGSYPIFGKYMFLRYPNWAAKFFVDALLEMREIAPDERIT